jgi:hypothetical protein
MKFVPEALRRGELLKEMGLEIFKIEDDDVCI